jgi:hypothetical protein
MNDQTGCERTKMPESAITWTLVDAVRARRCGKRVESPGRGRGHRVKRLAFPNRSKIAVELPKRGVLNQAKLIAWREISAAPGRRLCFWSLAIFEPDSVCHFFRAGRNVDLKILKSYSDPRSDRDHFSVKVLRMLKSASPSILTGKTIRTQRGRFTFSWLPVGRARRNWPPLRRG